MSDIESTSPKPTDPSALLGSLLSNPDLMRNISSMLGGANTETAEQTTPSAAQPPTNEAVAEGISRVLSNPEMMAKLPDVMRMLAPMMQRTPTAGGVSATAAAMPEHKGERDRRGCRNDLLLALKPFLSPERCRAIDMLLGLSRLGDALQKMI
jgi:hypothetical protein